MNEAIDLYGGSVEFYFESRGVRKSMQTILSGESGLVMNGVNFINSVSVNVNLLKFTEVQVVLTPPFEEAVKLIESGVIGLGYTSLAKTGGKKSKNVESGTSDASKLAGMNKMVIRLNYGGKFSPYYTCYLMQPDIEMSPEGIQITLNGIGMLFPATKTSTNNSYVGKSREQIIKTMRDSQEVELITTPGDTVATKALSKIEATNHNMSDFSLIKDMLEKSHCKMRDVGSNTKGGVPQIQIVSMDFLRKQKPKYTFVCYKQINPNAGIYPMMGFKTTISNYLLGLTFGVQGEGFNSDNKKEPTPAEKDMTAASLSKTSSSAPVTDGTAGGASSDGRKGEVQSFVSRGGSSTSDVLSGILKAATDTAFQYEINTVGIVDLLPGPPVKVEVGNNVKFLSGDYDCIGVHHEFSESGVETKITLARTFGLAAAAEQGIEAIKSKAVAGNSAPPKKSKDITGSS